MNIALWIIQALLALLFLFAGGLKLVLPPEAMTGGGSNPAHFSGAFLKFIGVCEVLGGLGLILPGLLKIRQGLTAIAAIGLVIIMIGAIAITVMDEGPIKALTPFVVGVLAAFVAYGRWKLAPYSAR